MNLCCRLLNQTWAFLMLGMFAQPTLAGGSGENAVLIVDPASADSLWAANHYRQARDIPSENVLFMNPGAANFAEFVAVNQAALLGELEARGIADHIDYVIVMPGANFYVPASGLITDPCVSVQRFGIAGAYASTFVADQILAGQLFSMSNRYKVNSDSVRGFDSEVSYFAGEPSTSPLARRYFISAMLGYTGERGNTMQEILDNVDRSVGADGTFPIGTTYYMHTTDDARSSPRHDTYPVIADKIIALGGSASVLFDVLPFLNHDCLGVMTGWATPDIDGADMTLLPGSFADHLTSFAGRFDTSSQTKMSRWLAKGASATSGAVEEPCNYAGKFPRARLHLYYLQGLSMGEAWFRSMAYFPFQNLLYGDPLTRPFSAAPMVELLDVPSVPISGSVVLHPTAVAATLGANIESLEVLIDGVLYRRLQPEQSFSLQSAALSDGWHELRVLAYDDTDARHVGRFVTSFEVDNHGRSASVGASSLAGDQGQAFDFNLSSQGSGLLELRLVQNGRVMAASSSSPETLQLYGANLGAGPLRVQAEAVFTDGSLVRSEPLELVIDASGTGTSGALPEAFSYERNLLAGMTQVVELPASFDDDLASATFTIVSAPAQATIVGSASGAHCTLEVNPGATVSDTLVYRVSTPSGTSGDATITLQYNSFVVCPTPTSYCTSLPNTGGVSAVIASSGSTSLSANDLTIAVSGAIPGQFGLFFYGAGQSQTAFGDGFLCVTAGGSGIFRLPPAQAGGVGGEVSRVIDLNTDPHLSGSGAIEAGSTWNFQYWYRDTVGVSGFNLSNGLSAEFCP
ncbi:MAG: hypothetical protein ACI8X5_003393 [Planctomycetota bacterium]|jgi:hypothetical protein